MSAAALQGRHFAPIERDRAGASLNPVKPGTFNFPLMGTSEGHSHPGVEAGNARSPSKCDVGCDRATVLGFVWLNRG